VGFYRDHVFPRVMNLACNTKETRRIRAAVCAPLAGEVLEIGFGTGLNLPHLGPGVTRLLAVDPLERCARSAASCVWAGPSTLPNAAGLPTPRCRRGKTASTACNGGSRVVAT